MATPESARKAHDVAPMEPSAPACPVSAAMSQAKASTTMVRIAVATSGSVLVMPSLARPAVTPAKSAEPPAARSHMDGHPPWMQAIVSQDPVGALSYRYVTVSTRGFLLL